MPHIEDLYKAELVLLGKTYKATGATPTEAITNLKVDKAFRRPSVLTMRWGNETREKLISALNTARLFGGSKLGREIAIKNLTTLFS